jgi:threonine/homoserine/homoserine lactone efflux protein
MPPAANLLLFSVASLALLVVPGPAVIYIVGRSAAQGRRAGMVSVAGIHSGTLVHIGAAVTGMSAIVMASAAAFTVVKLAGAAYLVYLGLRMLLRSEHAADARPVVERASLRRVFADGFTVNVLNPKTALFFLSFVPQFVDPAAGAVHLQLLVLGGLFVALGLVSDGTYALAAAWAGRRLGGRSGRGPRRLIGMVYIGLGVGAAAGHRPT